MLQSGRKGRLAYAVTVGAALGCLLLSGCASKEKKKEKPDHVLQELVMMFPGHYDNSLQVQSDLAKGVQPPHEPIVLDVVPIEAIMIGDNVFYIQESVLGEPNRVLGQKIVMFGVVKGDIVQTDYSLREPLRWRNGQLNPDLFKGLMTTDVHSTKGCSLRWKRDEENEKLTATNDPKTCHARAGGAGHISMIESRAELSSLEYATSEQAFDKPGHLAQGRAEEPFYRFHKAQGE